MLKDLIAEVLGDRVRATIADAVGVSPSLISHWTAGRHRPDNDQLTRLLDACGATAELRQRCWAAHGVAEGDLATPDEVATRRRALADCLPVGP